MIMELRKFLKEEHAKVKASLIENRREQPLHFHGGVYDDEDERKARVREGELLGAYRGLQAKQAFIEECWKQVVNAFGRSDVDLALVEEEQQIGSIPFVSTEEPR